MTPIRIKPHHFLDIIKLHGAGFTVFQRDEAYHHDFYRVGNAVLADKNCLLIPTVDHDDICHPCRYFDRTSMLCSDRIAHIAGISSKDAWNRLIDTRILACTPLSCEHAYTAFALCSILYDARDEILNIWKEDAAENTNRRFELFKAGAENYLQPLLTDRGSAGKVPADQGISEVIHGQSDHR